MDRIEYIRDDRIKSKVSGYLMKMAAFKKKDPLPLVISFIGGTGVGKSSILNLIAGKPVSRSSAVRPTTSRPVVFYPEEHYFNPEVLGLEDITFSSQSYKPDDVIRDLNIIFFDLPDIDSIRESHHKVAEKAVFSSDVVIFVVSPDKYGDSVIYRFLEKAVKTNKFIFVILNKTDLLNEQESQITRTTLMDPAHFGRYREAFQYLELCSISSTSYNREKLIEILKKLSMQKNKIRNVEMLKEKNSLHEELSSYLELLDSSLETLTHKHKSLFSHGMETSMKLNVIAGKAFDSIKSYHRSIYRLLYPFSPLSPVNFINTLAKYAFEKLILLLKFVLKSLFFLLSMIKKAFTVLGFTKRPVSSPEPVKNSHDLTDVSEIINEMRNVSSENFRMSFYISHIYDYIKNFRETANIDVSGLFDRDALAHNLENNVNSYFESLYLQSRTLKKKLHRYDYFLTVFDWLFILLSLLLYSPLKQALSDNYLLAFFSQDFILFYVLVFYITVNFVKKLTLNMIMDSSYDRDLDSYTRTVLLDFIRIKHKAEECIEEEIDLINDEINSVRSYERQI